ncbi:MAG: c-type cytochrome [Sedimenticola sp.]|nr:c-type cytochrome [Sedimenticola sp.]
MEDRKAVNLMGRGGVMQGKAGLSLLISGMLVFGPTVAEERTDPLAQYRPILSESFKQLLREVDPASGERDFMRKCSSCHDQQRDGGHGKGPYLWNLMGRRAGSLPGFEYSDAMRNSGHTWDIAALNYYLADTEQAVPGRIMNFRGIRRDKVRARLIAYLLQFNDAPPPLPE